MRNAGVWVGLMILIFSGSIFGQSLTYDYYGSYGPGPGLFPLWLSGLLMVFSMLYMIDSVRKAGMTLSQMFPKGAGFKKFASIVAALVIFLLLVPFTGYIIASIIMLLILFFTEYKWYWALGISIVVTMAIFYIFQSLLHVPLPELSIG